MNTLLVKYGSFRPVMRIWACVMAVCGGLALLGMKPRLPITHARSKVVPVNFSFLKSPLFAILVSRSADSVIEQLTHNPKVKYGLHSGAGLRARFVVHTDLRNIDWPFSSDGYTCSGCL